jgi:hypothetical protein
VCARELGRRNGGRNEGGGGAMDFGLCGRLPLGLGVWIEIGPCVAERNHCFWYERDARAQTVK